MAPLTLRATTSLAWPSKSILARVFDFLASYGFAVVLLLLLMLLTFVGTLEQRHTSLFEVQEKYFASYWVRHEFFGVPPENMVIQGYGESNLKIPTLEAEPRNRRAVVRRITPLLQTASLR